VGRLHAQIVKMLADPDLARRLRARVRSPEQYARAARSIPTREFERWRKLIADLKLKVE